MKRLKITVLMCISFVLLLCCCSFTEINTIAAETNKGYELTVQDGILRCVYNGKLQKNVYISIIQTEEMYTVVSPKTKGSVIYYFNNQGEGNRYKGTNIIPITYKDKVENYYIKKGNLYTGWYKKGTKKYYYTNGCITTGWKKIGGKKYYFDTAQGNRGVMLTNKIAGSKKEGYYYVDSTGIQITNKEVKLAVKFVNAHTKSSWSQDKKLKSCFNYLWKNYKYKRFYETPKASTMADYANYMLSKKKGNCYRYAASFAYIARVLGYDTRVAVGKISSARGGMTPHGWTEVKINGKWYMCDANMQRNHPSINSYMKTNSSYAYRHSCSKRYKLTIKNGKVSWK